MPKNRMSISEFMKLQSNTKEKTSRHNDEEHRLQCACVNWFRIQYPKLHYILFAVPNAGKRDPRIGAYMKAEGLLPGAPDLILLKSNRRYCALCIEMKTKTGRQQASQKKWEMEAKKNDIMYVICRSLEDFKKVITEYFEDMT